MPIRIEVQPDGEIEIMRSWINDPMSRFLHFRDLDDAVRILRYLIRREIRRVDAAKFVPELQREARKAFKQLEKEAEHATKK